MSGGGGGPVIINALINTGKFSQTDKDQLQLIQDRSPTRCSWLDAWRVAKIVRKRLKQP